MLHQAEASGFVVSTGDLPHPRLVFLTTTISADFSPITAAIADDGAPRRNGTPAGEISPGKNTVLRHPTASFTSVAERRNFAVLPCHAGALAKAGASSFHHVGLV